uniref:Uncharacterized protein n=1 Tax=Angiostrongylus cantonensis TaxID=6313 RepID=A0A0K0CXE6_ANGCA
MPKTERQLVMGARRDEHRTYGSLPLRNELSWELFHGQSMECGRRLPHPAEPVAAGAAAVLSGSCAVTHDCTHFVL